MSRQCGFIRLMLACAWLALLNIQVLAGPDYLASGTFALRSNSDYRYLSIRDAVPAVGSIASMSRFNAGDTNRHTWRFIPKADGFYQIKSQTGFFLTQKRVLVPTLDPDLAEDSQLWRVVDAGDGFYTIQSKTNKYLAVTDTRRRDGGIVSFTNSISYTDTQKWHLIKWTGDGRRMTGFVPATHGFKFANTFQGVDASYAYGGLCGGMVYSAMDYFSLGMAIPPQTYTPANRTPLQSHIYARQNKAAMENQLDKWMELRLNPFGWRDAEFFEWGLRGSGGGRLQELQEMINSFNAAPLGLYEGGTANFEGWKAGDHQVLAVGYALGRYRGDLGSHKQDLKIFVYDPNYPGQTMTMVPDVTRKAFFYVEDPAVRRTYFVDRKYAAVTPPRLDALAANEPDGSIRHIYASFRTGGDDLRGGNDNVNVTVSYTDGTSQTFLNVNRQARWVDNYEETVPLVLNRPVRKADITSFVLTTTFGGGIGGDNWNLDSFRVSNGGNIELICAGCRAEDPKPLQRFTGDNQYLRMPMR